MFGLAQMFSSVSPAMFRELEVAYTSRICARFGLVYYGCCDPLDGKMAEVRMIPNVRKVSMSPWSNEDRGAAAMSPLSLLVAGPVSDWLGVRTWYMIGEMKYIFHMYYYQ